GHMCRSDIDRDGVWDPGHDDDPENKQCSVVPLSALAQTIIDAVPIVAGDGDYVFSLDGLRPINGYSKDKAALDVTMRAILLRDNPDHQWKGWQQRDLRRTARTLMARAGVPREIAEHAVGHKLPGTEGIYNRYDYLEEKRTAFARLADLIAE